MVNVFNNAHIQRLARVVRTEAESQPKVRSTGGLGSVGRSDSVNLSPEARVLAAIKQRLEAVPDVRAAKVERLRSQIQQGAYHVPAEDIAKAILEEGRLL